MGLDPTNEDEMFTLANGPVLGNGPVQGVHHFGLDWYLGPDLRVSSLFEPNDTKNDYKVIDSRAGGLDCGNPGASGVRHVEGNHTVHGCPQFH